MGFAYLIEPPFNYVSPDGHIIGCDIELIRYVVSCMESLELDLVEAEFSELLPGLSNGNWRMTTGLFDTPERREVACFSRPIWALTDGLLVQEGNPLALTGYCSVAENNDCILAVIKNQFQHSSAVEFGVPEERIRVFNTYTEAVESVLEGDSDAYVSVARAHEALLSQHPDWKLDSLSVPMEEKLPAFGCFAFAVGDEEFRDTVNTILAHYLGSDDHRSMMQRYGFSHHDIDLILDKD